MASLCTLAGAIIHQTLQLFSNSCLPMLCSISALLCPNISSPPLCFLHSAPALMFKILKPLMLVQTFHNKQSQPSNFKCKMHNWSEQFCKPAKLTVSVCKQCQCLFKHSWSEPNLQTSNFHSSSSISKQGTLHFLSVVPTSATQISKQFSSSEALSLISDPLSKSTKQCSFHSS